MAKITTIVTHPGAAHRDDLLAVSVALYLNQDAVVERRDATEEDLADPGTLVLDVGGRHEPELNNFDHHQFPRDAAPTCALSLYLKHIGYYETAKAVFNWVEVTEVLDSKGPNAAAAFVGCDSKALFALQSPVEGYVIRGFSHHTRLKPRDLFHTILTDIGCDIIYSISERMERAARLNEEARTAIVKGHLVAIAPESITEKPAMGLTEWGKAQSQTTALIATISRDDRGSGWCVFRVDDHPALDLSRVKDDPRVLFAHVNGFVLKTKSLIHLSEVLSLVNDSVVS